MHYINAIKYTFMIAIWYYSRNMCFQNILHSKSILFVSLFIHH